jgi:antibiotic biosynthesis monooxygenase (ABM) superfamily enzyme
MEGARNWLGSAERQKRLEGATPLLVGRDDVHIVQDGASAARTAPVSAVISTRVKPGQEAEYLLWEHKIAVAQSKATGLQGYRFEPAIPGVQDDFVAILRFDSEANLNKWLASPERKTLVDEAALLTEEFHTRTVQTGFEQWFRDATSAGSPPPAAWKMDAIVLVLLYPIVFLWSVWFAFPVLTDKFHMPFAPALFLGNIFSVALTGFLVPWLANRLTWWLTPDPARRMQMNLLGGGLMLASYAVMVLAFWKLF